MLDSVATSPEFSYNRFGQYRVDAYVGKGGEATVWRGTDMDTAEPVAIKITHPPTNTSQPPLPCERFCIADLPKRHPNLPIYRQWFSLPENRQQYAIVLDWIPNAVPLADHLKQTKQRLPEEHALAVFSQCLDALVAIAERSIIHRDIKPENLLLRPDLGLSTPGAVTLIDFGLAYYLKDDRRNYPYRSSTHFAGSALYVDPLYAQHCTPNPTTDLYSLGAVLFEMLTGQPYLDEHQGVQAVLRQSISIDTEQRLREGNFPPDIHDFLSRALSRELNKRFPSALDMHACFQDILRSRTAAALARAVR